MRVIITIVLSLLAFSFGVGASTEPASFEYSLPIFNLQTNWSFQLNTTVSDETWIMKHTTKGCLYENGCENFEYFMASDTPMVKFVDKEIALRIAESYSKDAVVSAIQTLAEYTTLNEEDLKQIKVHHIHDTGLGPLVVILKQEIDGLEVYRERISVVLSRSNLHPIAVSGSLSLDKYQGSNFKMNILNILKIMLNDAIGKHSNLTSVKIFEENNFKFAAVPTIPEVCQPIRFKQILYRSYSQLISSYYLEIFLSSGSSCTLYSYIISSETGAILSRQSKTHYAFTYRSFASPFSYKPTDGPIADYTPHPTGTPDGSVPSDIPASLITRSTSDPWLLDGSTETNGNNVDCYADISAPNGYDTGDIRATTTAPGVFDYFYDTSSSPQSSNDQRKASVTQAFYTINWLHDFFYNSGFNEEFNAQKDNYGRGGLGNDPILAEVQDYEGNSFAFARISTPQDGFSPRIEFKANNMYDMSLDNTVVAHEWGHYLTSRLAYLENAQGRILGEGYSDFIALLMMLEQGDNLDGTFAVGIYAARGTSANAAYYGIRRFPYSTDMTKNGLTFKHISDSATLPSTPISMDFTINQNSNVQNAGEVWATMLWECYIGLVKDSSRLTFTQAQDLMKNYLVASLKVLPGNPTFTEARDSLLSVAAAEDAAIFYQAFAKRGLGTGAISPARGSVNNTGLVESFDNVATLVVTYVTTTDNTTSCDMDGILDASEAGYLLVTVKNSHIALSVENMTVSIATSFASLELVETAAIVTLEAGSQVTIPFEVELGQLTDIQLVPLTIILGSNSIVAYVYVNYDRAGASSTTDTVEINNNLWTTAAQYIYEYSDPTTQASYAEPYISTSEGWSRTAHNEDYMWYGEAVVLSSKIELVSPLLSVSGTLKISFESEYSFLPNDGAIIEIYDGNNYTDVTSFTGISLQTVSDTSNVLNGRNVITGTATGKITMNLGTAFQGKSVYLHFVIATNNVTASAGWYIDNIHFDGISNTPFANITKNVCNFGTSTTSSTASTGSSSSTSGTTSTSSTTSTTGTTTEVSTATTGANLTSTTGNYEITTGTNSTSAAGEGLVNEDNSSNQAGVIVGAVLGSILGCLLLAVIVTVLWRRRQMKKKQPKFSIELVANKE